MLLVSDACTATHKAPRITGGHSQDTQQSPLYHTPTAQTENKTAASTLKVETAWRRTKRRETTHKRARTKNVTTASYRIGRTEFPITTTHTRTHIHTIISVASTHRHAQAPCVHTTAIDRQHDNEVVRATINSSGSVQATTNKVPATHACVKNRGKRVTAGG